MTFFRRYWRFSIFLVVALAVGIVLFRLGWVGDWQAAVLFGFDIGAIVFLALTWSMMNVTGVEAMRRRANENDPDHHILLYVGSIIVGVVVIAVFLEVNNEQTQAIVLSTVTLAIAWLFGNLLFALHYAHTYYTPLRHGDRKGLCFPGDVPPDHWDFVYFAFGLGMTFQVSDVSVTDRKIRHMVLVQSLIAFVFNISVIALSVSFVTDMLKPDPAAVAAASAQR